MQWFKKTWHQVPKRLREPIILTIGLTFVITSGLIGWLPGPGGIPLFLIGVSILATEFHWAARLRDFILAIIKQTGSWMRRNPLVASIAILFGLSISLTLAYFFFLT